MVIRKKRTVWENPEDRLKPKDCGLGCLIKDNSKISYFGQIQQNPLHLPKRQAGPFQVREAVLRSSRHLGKDHRQSLPSSFTAAIEHHHLHRMEVFRSSKRPMELIYPHIIPP